MRRMILAVIVAIGVACCADEAQRETSSAAAGSGGQGATGGSADGGATSGNEVCDQYLQCLSQVSPTELAVAIDAYGTEGTCWMMGDAELCTDACMTGMAQHHEAAPSVCVECFDDGACGETSCREGSCVVCMTTFSCTGGACACEAGESCCDPEEPSCADSSTRCDLFCEVCE